MVIALVSITLGIIILFDLALLGGIHLIDKKIDALQKMQPKNDESSKTD